ncbi:MAG: nucleotidyltransferase family protein [Candidatus Latescibacterota bacterium]|jgi:NDP-sugar pyrophosphorylase family protein
MVLAAGKGSRLRPLTDTCPKPMIPIGGRPLLEHVVRLLARHGFDELVVNLHHLPQPIQDHLGDGSRWGVRIRYSLEPELLGTAGAVRRVAAFFDEPFLVYYGDNLANFDLTALWHTHRDSGAVATLGLLWMDEPTTRGIVGLDPHGRVDRLIEKPRPEEIFSDYLVNAGTYVLEPSVLDWIPASGACDFAREVFPRLLAAGMPLAGHRLQGELLSTDTLERYRQAEEAVANGAFALP